jgi:sugar O-acyltransferase (sialic acid O-acetyltransferase NeuD family)
MARPLILIAAGGLAAETAEAARATGQYDVIGFADDKVETWDSILVGCKVLGGLEVIDEHADAAVLLCAGKGASRRVLAQRLALGGFDVDRFARIIHPSVEVPDSCRVGLGSIVLAGCVLTASVEIGSHVVAMPGVTFTHDDVVADFATLCAGVTLGGSVHVGEAAYLGMSSAVREQRSIGADAVVGMGSVVLADVPDAQTWVGNPARALIRGSQP